MKKRQIKIKSVGANGEWLSELWAYRNLAYVFAWRDLTVRYKQTAIGLIWSILRPILTVAAFTIVFGRIANLQSEGNSPYSILVFTGLLPWMFFSSSLVDSSNSLIDNSNLVGKIYFPRIILPIASIFSSLVDFMIGSILLGLLLIFYDYLPSSRIIYLPFFFVLLLMAALGPSLIACALNVKYRDFRYIIPFALQIGFYISPIGFSTSLVPEKYKFLYYINPMAGILDGFRWCILSDVNEIYFQGWLISFSMILLMFIIGIVVFRYYEKAFADLI